MAVLNRLSLDRYHEMIEAGAFADDERLELIEGVLVPMSPKGAGHDDAIEWLTGRLARGLPERYGVRVQSAITLEATGSEPEPDLVVVDHDVARPYHPAYGLLVIEVAASSLLHDRRVKAPLYAAAGVPDYWIVNLVDRVVEVHREPRDERYASVEAVTSTVTPCALQGAPTLAVAELFEAAFRHVR